MRTHFLHRGHRKKRLGRSRLNDDLSRLKALRTHNLPPGRLKCDFGEDEAMFQVVERLATSFSASWASKKRHGLGRLRDVLSRRMVLRTHNLLSKRLKKRLWFSR
jgi:hypothetical protein